MNMFRNCGAAIRMIRQRRGLNQAQLARLSELGKSQLSKYESGRELPKLESLGRILTALEVTPESFFGAVAYLNDPVGEPPPRSSEGCSFIVPAEVLSALERISGGFGDLFEALQESSRRKEDTRIDRF